MSSLKKKNKKQILSAAVISIMLLTATPSQAFFGLFGFGVPVLEPTSTASQLAKVLSTTMTKASAAADRVKQEIANIRTSKLFSFFSKFGLRLDHKPVAGAKILEIPSVADPYLEAGPNSVKEAVYKLFLKYPSHDIPTQVKYRKMSRDFYDDTVLEAYSAAREVEKYLSTDVAAKFAKLQANLHEGGGEGATEPEALNETLYNNYLAYQTIETITRVLQEVTAIKSQLRAAKAINDDVEPLEHPDPDPDLQASLNENSKQKIAVLYGTSQIKGQEIIASAAVSDNISKIEDGTPQKVVLSNGVVVENVKENPIVKVNVDEDGYNEDEDMYKPFEDYAPISPGGMIQFQQSDDPKLEHPFYEARYRMNEMERMEFIYDKIMTAINIHNLIKKIRMAEDDFNSYKRAVALHEKSRRMLKLVDQCAINMLRNNFSDAENVWCGQSSCADVVTSYKSCPFVDYENMKEDEELTCDDDVSKDYVSRNGISGWASDQYALGKAALSSETESLEIDPMPVPAEDVIHVKKTESVEEEGIPYVEENSEAINARANEYEVVARKSELLPWQIGAVAAKTLSENPSQWGTISKPYPVWNDQKNFFMQYTDGKYENLPIYLQYISQAQTFSGALSLVNQAAEKIVIKEIEANRKKTIAEINADDDLDANEKRERIEQANQKAKEDTEATKKEKIINDQYIAQIAALSKDDMFPYLKYLNMSDDELMKTELGGQAKGQVEQELSRTGISLGTWGKYPEILMKRKMPELASQKALDLGSAVSSIASAADAAKATSFIPMSGVVGQSLGITAAVNEHIKATIVALQNSLCSLGDDLYYGGNKAASMHQSMMSSLENYVYTISAGEGETLSYQPLKPSLSGLDTSEDTQYFVGLRPLTAREARAPFAPAKMGYAPVREIFHYDDVDLDNSEPGSRKSFLNHGGDIPPVWEVILSDKPFVEKDIDLGKILNTGIGTNTILRSGIFPCNLTLSLVTDEQRCIDDSNYNVEHERQCGVKALQNPVEQCLKDWNCGNGYFNQKTIGGLDNRIKSTKSVFSNLTKTEADYAGGVVNPCVGYTLNIKEGGGIADSEGFFGMEWPLYSEGAGAGFSPLKDDFDPTRGRSELGIFLEPDEVSKPLNIVDAAYDAYKGNVVDKEVSKTLLVMILSQYASQITDMPATETHFRPSMLDIYNEIAAMAESDDESFSKGEESDSPSYMDVRKNLLGLMPFQQNQVGGFLIAAEKERQYRETRKELEKAIRQLEADIAMELKKLNFEVKNAFSLLNPDDYTVTKDTLNETKEKLLNEIDKRISDVKVEDNKIVKYRLREFNRMRMALVKDKDELVSLSGGVDSGPSFDEVIKMEEANMAVQEEYRKKDEEAFQEALRDLSDIYCANYNEGAYDPEVCRFPVYIE